jgi:hypothetical protein
MLLFSPGRGSPGAKITDDFQRFRRLPNRSGFNIPFTAMSRFLVACVLVIAVASCVAAFDICLPKRHTVWISQVRCVFSIVFVCV